MKNLFYILVFVVLVIIAVMVYRKGKTVLTETLNPASDKNIVNRGVTEIVRTITGDKNATLGTKIYDVVQSVKRAPAQVLAGIGMKLKKLYQPAPNKSLLERDEYNQAGY